jgi:hypothetical protein
LNENMSQMGMNDGYSQNGGGQQESIAGLLGTG